MFTSTLQKYSLAFNTIKGGQTPFGLAPHKPILLLSIIELINKGEVNNNCFTPLQVANTFKENWQLLVTTANTEDISQPFYYLQNDAVEAKPFWQLHPKPGYQINKPISSLTKLTTICAYGSLATDLWLLINDEPSRNALKQLLLANYFPEQATFFEAAKQVDSNYLLTQTQSILQETEPKYGNRRVYTTEEVIVRDGLFQRWVTNSYQYQCSFTGMKWSNSFNFNFVDACHIIPFSVSFNDHQTNGIALCPNMHRAFDRGLISVSEDYKILVSPHLTEATEHPYALAQLKGRRIILPQQQIHYPAQEALAWHRGVIFKGGR